MCAKSLELCVTLCDPMDSVLDVNGGASGLERIGHN